MSSHAACIVQDSGRRKKPVKNRDQAVGATWELDNGGHETHDKGGRFREGDTADPECHRSYIMQRQQ